MERKVQFYSEGTPCAGVLGIPDDYKSGEKRGAVIFCHGFTGVKEMWLPKNAERLRAERPGKAIIYGFVRAGRVRCSELLACCFCFIGRLDLSQGSQPRS